MNLDNFTPTINSDNRFNFLNVDSSDEIIIGGSCTHVFELPFVYSTYAKSGKIIYKQGLEVVLEINIVNAMITASPSGTSIINVDLGPIQTQLFDDTILDTFCQVKLITITDKVMYDTPHKIKVIAPLKVEPVVAL